MFAVVCDRLQMFTKTNDVVGKAIRTNQRLKCLVLDAPFNSQDPISPSPNMPFKWKWIHKILQVLDSIMPFKQSGSTPGYYLYDQ